MEEQLVHLKPELMHGDNSRLSKRMPMAVQLAHPQPVPMRGGNSRPSTKMLMVVLWEHLQQVLMRGGNSKLSKTRPIQIRLSGHGKLENIAHCTDTVNDCFIVC